MFNGKSFNEKFLLTRKYYDFARAINCTHKLTCVCAYACMCDCTSLREQYANQSQIFHPTFPTQIPHSTLKTRFQITTSGDFSIIRVQVHSSFLLEFSTFFLTQADNDSPCKVFWGVPSPSIVNTIINQYWQKFYKLDFLPNANQQSENTGNSVFYHKHQP